MAIKHCSHSLITGSPYEWGWLLSISEGSDGCRNETKIFPWHSLSFFSPQWRWNWMNCISSRHFIEANNESSIKARTIPGPISHRDFCSRISDAKKVRFGWKKKSMARKVWLIGIFDVYLIRKQPTEKLSTAFPFSLKASWRLRCLFSFSSASCFW